MARKRALCTIKPQSKPKPKPTQDKQPRNKPKVPGQQCLNDLKMIECPYCLKIYKSYRTLGCHLIRKHSAQLETDPKTIISQKYSTKKQLRGRPTKIITQDLSDSQDSSDSIEKPVIDFLAKFEEIFYRIVEQQRQKQANQANEKSKRKVKTEQNAKTKKIRKKPIAAKDYAICDDSLGPQQMRQVIQTAGKALLALQLPISVKAFGSKCIKFIKLFIDYLARNRHPNDIYDEESDQESHDFCDPMSLQTQQQVVLDKHVEENDLEEMIKFEAKSNYFESQGKKDWESFVFEFSQEFRQRIKRDLLILTWASGMVREDMFLEYFCFMINVIENESRVLTTKGQDSSQKSRIVEGRIRPKLIGAEWRQKLINSRADFLNNSIKQKTPKQDV